MTHLCCWRRIGAPPADTFAGLFARGVKLVLLLLTELATVLVLVILLSKLGIFQSLEDVLVEKVGCVNAAELQHLMKSKPGPVWSIL